MKKIFYILFVLMLAGSGKNLYAQPSGNWINLCQEFDESGGKGSTSENPILIENPRHLAYLAWKVNDEGINYANTYFKLTANILLVQSYWTPIGMGELSTEYFNGHFDGNNYIIQSPIISDPGNYQGLFGVVGPAATIKNLFVGACNISGKDNVGALAGKNYGKVSRCFSTGTITATGDNVGGLIGANSGSLSECFSTCAVTGNWTGNTQWEKFLSGGGLVGRNNVSGIIKQCYATGPVTSNSSGYYNITIGGLTGTNNGVISESFSAGAVCGNNSGGFIGRNESLGVIVSCIFDRQGAGNEIAFWIDLSGSAARITAGKTHDLIYGKLPDGFDPTIWVARRSSYPQLRCFAENVMFGVERASAYSTVPFTAENANDVRSSFWLPKRVLLSNGYNDMQWRLLSTQSQDADIIISRVDSIYGWVNANSSSNWHELTFPEPGSNTFNTSPFNRIIKFRPVARFSHRYAIILGQAVSDNISGRELRINASCDATPRDVVINVQTSNLNYVYIDNALIRSATVNVSKAGIYRKTIRIISFTDGNQVIDTYTVAVERPFLAEQIFAPQRWHDVLAINNNYLTNGGYIIYGYEWYKNDQKMNVTGGYIHEPGGLDRSARYTATLTLDADGTEKVSTCPAEITETELKTAVFPNPVMHGQPFSVKTGSDAQTVIRLFDAAGNIVSAGVFAGNVVEYAAPDVAGYYILQLSADGIVRNVKIIVE